MYGLAVFSTAFGWLQFHGVWPALVVLALWLSVRNGKPELIVGIVLSLFVGVLLIPATTSPRPMPKQVVCRNRLRELGIALRNYEMVNDRLPPAFITDEHGKPMHSWRVLILPYIEELELYRKYRFDEPWDGPNNSTLATVDVPIFRSPLHKTSPGHTSYSVVVSVNSAMRSNLGCKISDVVDGTSKTVTVVESQCDVPWTQPEAFSVDDLLASLRGDASRHGTSQSKLRRRNLNVAYLDGRACQIGGGGTREAYASLFSIDGNEPDSTMEFPVVDRVVRDAGWDPKDGVAVSMIGFCLMSVFPLTLKEYRGQLLAVGPQRVF